MKDKIVWNIRTAIYVAGICAVVLSASLKGADALWPPDMVPHPTPPWDQPEGEEEPELS